MMILWITHRRDSEMSSTSRRGVSAALNNAGWDVKFMSPDGDYPVERSQQLGKGHGSFSRSVSAKLANIDAERAVERAYQAEIIRTKAIGEAMFKSGKAVRLAFASSGRYYFLRISAAGKKIKSWLSP